MKETGILMAVSSLPAPYGAGDLGRSAMAWVDLLAQNGVTIWQILPLSPTGYGNSPYQPYSSFAGDELYLSLETLAAEGLLPHAPEPFRADSTRVAYDAVRAWKEPFLRQAYGRFSPDADFEAFAAQDWVRSYAVFRAFKKANGGQCWLTWEPWQRDWPAAQGGDLAPYAEEIGFQTFLQYMFARQWQTVHAYANEKGVRILGDVPFYVGVDSVDVWAGRENFLLDADGHPTFIAGVPPDYFSETGQRWGNPIYDWAHMEQDGFRFWKERIGYNQTLFDIIRIDHFRAFDTFWKIPASCPTAVEGEWIEAPGYAVLDALYATIEGLTLAAEDLGDLRPEVLTLRDHYRLKGMKVLEFTLDLSGRYARDGGARRANQILYTGTHDNDTLYGWYASLRTAERRKLRRWLRRQGFANGTVTDRLLAYALSDPSEWVILPVQDILGLSGWARMNLPSTVGSPNWEWRLADQTAAAHALRRLRAQILHRRTDGTAEEVER